MSSHHVLIPLLISGYLCFAEQAGATDYFVVNNGAPTGGNGSAGNPWGTVSEAVVSGVLLPGDVLHLAAGSYVAGETFPIALPNGVHVLGEGSATTSVGPPGAAAVCLSLALGANATILEMLAVNGATGQQTILVDANAASVQILDCSVGGGAFGVAMTGSAGTGTQLLIHNSSFSGFGQSGVDLRLDSYTGPVVLTLSEVTMDGGGSGGRGVYAEFVQPPTSGADGDYSVFFDQVEISNCLDNPVTFLGSGTLPADRFQCDVRDSRFRACGLAFQFSPGAFSATGNVTAVFNSWNSEYLDGVGGGLQLSPRLTGGATLNFDAALSGNTITGNAKSGLVLFANFGTVGTALLNLDLGGGPLLAAAGRNTIRNNGATPFFDLDNTTASPVWAQGNWWFSNDPLQVEDRINHAPDNPALGLVDFTNLLVDPLSFQASPSSVPNKPGTPVTLSADPGSAFLGQAGTAGVLALDVGGIGVTDYTVSPDGSELSFPLPDGLTRAADAPITINVVLPGGQTGATTVQLVAPGGGPGKKNRDGGGGGCFVATAAFGDYDAPEVLVLRRLRDESLRDTALGRAFIDAYYRHSPPLAEAVAARPWARGAARLALAPLVAGAKLWLDAPWVYGLAALFLTRRWWRRRAGG